MKPIIDFEKTVDVLDKGILALNQFRRSNTLSEDLKTDILNILKFFDQAKETRYQDLLYDKHISINKTHLEKIHSKIIEISFPADTAQKAAFLLEKIETGSKIPEDEIDSLQDYLFEISKPIWVSLNLNN